MLKSGRKVTKKCPDLQISGHLFYFIELYQMSVGRARYQTVASKPA